MNRLRCLLFIWVQVDRSATTYPPTWPPSSPWPSSSPVESTTVPSPCPAGWLNAHDDGCFRFLADDVNLTWAGAMSACEGVGGYLAEPKTKSQMEFLTSVAALELDFTDIRNWWLGLTDLGHEGRWEWIHSMEVNKRKLNKK